MTARRLDVALKAHPDITYGSKTQGEKDQGKDEIRAPIYANPTYPYGSQSPPNPIIGYLEVGSKPHVRRIALVEPWPYWEVQPQSGARGYLFAPDVEVTRLRSTRQK